MTTWKSFEYWSLGGQKDVDITQPIVLVLSYGSPGSTTGRWNCDKKLFVLPQKWPSYIWIRGKENLCWRLCLWVLVISGDVAFILVWSCGHDLCHEWWFDERFGGERTWLCGDEISTCGGWRKWKTLIPFLILTFRNWLKKFCDDDDPRDPFSRAFFFQPCFLTKKIIFFHMQFFIRVWNCQLRSWDLCVVKHVDQVLCIIQWIGGGGKTLLWKSKSFMDPLQRSDEVLWTVCYLLWLGKEALQRNFSPFRVTHLHPTLANAGIAPPSLDWISTTNGLFDDSWENLYFLSKNQPKYAIGPFAFSSFILHTCLRPASFQWMDG